MGDPKRQVNKFQRPSHPWQRARIEEEKKLKGEYGLKNKSEIWKVVSKLKYFNQQAKRLIVAQGAQAELEKQNLLKRLQRLGLLKDDARLESILGLTTRDLMERRLQSLLCRKGIARTMKQARQMITHNHVCVGEKKVTSPSYLVKIEEEASLQFSTGSTFTSVDHPERTKAVKVQPPPRPERNSSRGRKNFRGRKSLSDRRVDGTRAKKSPSSDTKGTGSSNENKSEEKKVE